MAVGIVERVRINLMLTSLVGVTRGHLVNGYLIATMVQKELGNEERIQKL